MAGNECLPAVSLNDRAYLLHDPGRDSKVRGGFRVLRWRKCSEPESQFVRTEAFDFSSDGITFEIKDCRRESKIEERLLPIAQSIEAALDCGWTLLEEDLDAGHNIFEALTCEG